MKICALNPEIGLNGIISVESAFEGPMLCSYVLRARDPCGLWRLANECHSV